MKKILFIVISLIILCFFSFVRVDAIILENNDNSNFEEHIADAQPTEYLKIGMINDEISYNLKINNDYGECNVKYEYEDDKIDLLSNESKINLNSNEILKIKFRCIRNSVSKIDIKLNNGKENFRVSFYVYSEKNYVFAHEYGEESIKKLGLKYLYDNSIISKDEFDEKLKEIISIPSSNIYNFTANINSSNLIQNTNDDGVLFTGKIQWQDRVLNYHNFEGGIVKFYEVKQNNEEEYVGSCTTDSNGYYEKRILFNDSNNHNIKVRVYAEGVHLTVLDENDEIYFFESDQIYNINNNSNNVIYNPMIKNISQRKINGAMQIHQAMLLGYKFINTKLNLYSNLCGKIQVKFYTKIATAYLFNSVIGVSEGDHNYWDILLHEYSHYISDKLGLDQNPGGGHSLENLTDGAAEREESRLYGLRKAWGEGLATFLGIVIQKEVLVNSDIIDVCDEVYTDSSCQKFNLETLRDKGNLIDYGDGCEADVAGILYDIYDDTSESFDDISLPIVEIIDIIKQNNCIILSEFINAFLSKYPNKEVALGKIMYQTGATAYDIRLSTYNDGTISLTWKLGGGSDDFPNNRFSIVIFDDNYNKIYESDNKDVEKPEDKTIDYGYYIDHSANFSSYEAKIILNTSSNNKFYFGIYSQQTDDVITGKYLSLLTEVDRNKVVACAYKIKENIDCDTIINTNYLCNGNNSEYIGINVKCENNYDFDIACEKNFTASIYGENFNFIENFHAIYSNSTYRVSKTLLLDTKVFYIEIKLTEKNLTKNVNIKLEPKTKFCIEELTINTKKDVQLHKHNSYYCPYYEKEFIYDNIKSGFYDLNLKIKLSDGSILNLPANAISVYNSLNMQNVIDRFSIQGINNKASLKNGESTMSLFLYSNTEYYIKIKIPYYSTLESCEIIIKNVEKEEINIFEKDNSIDLGIQKIIFSESINSNCIQELNVKQPGVFSVEVRFSRLDNPNIQFLLLKTSTVGLSSPNDVELVNILRLGSNETTYVFPFLNLDEGIYYIGYYNLDIGSVSVSIFRYIDNSADEIYNGFQVDPNSSSCGSQIKILEKNLPESQKSYNYDVIIKGFTRLIYLNNSIATETSRLQYNWYSSNENVATVTNYGTVLGKSIGSTMILAVLKSNPRIIYVKEFIITDNGSHDNIVINLEQTYSLSSETKYVIGLNSDNCPYAQLSLYDWSISSNTDNNINAQLDNWYRLTVDSPGQIIITGNYKLNTKVVIRIVLTIVE